MSISASDVVPFTQARSNLSELADQVKAGAEKIITKNGESYVALIDAGRLDYYHRLERERIHLLLIDDLTDALEDLDAEGEDLPLGGDDDLGKIGGRVKISLADMDLPSWDHELQTDLAIIEALLASMHKVIPADDAKLQHLKAHLLNKIEQPINPGNKKVLIFTAFADTADYLYANLAPELLANFSIHSAKVTGKGAPKSTLKKTYDFQELLTLFSPRSKDKAIVLPKELAEIDLLIGTDCISEGQNLQDCDYVVNYDIHWNPVRIIQRFGRVDRIGSPNSSIQLVNYWPDISLDEYMHSPDLTQTQIAKLRELFPSCVKEAVGDGGPAAALTRPL